MDSFVISGAQVSLNIQRKRLNVLTENIVIWFMLSIVQSTKSIFVESDMSNVVIQSM
jgi:hypothetical protein